MRHTISNTISNERERCNYYAECGENQQHAFQQIQDAWTLQRDPQLQFKRMNITNKASFTASGSYAEGLVRKKLGKRKTWHLIFTHNYLDATC